MSVFVERIVATVAACVLCSAAAQALTLDFNHTDRSKTNATSAQVGVAANHFGDFGLSISTNSSYGLSLFNSNCGKDFGARCSGGDNDLASGPSYGTGTGTSGYNSGNTGLGRLLIAQDKPNWYSRWRSPDDLKGTYSFHFDFEQSVHLSTIDIADLDEGTNQVSFSARLSDGSEVDFSGPYDFSLLGTRRGDNSLRRFTFDQSDVDRFSVKFHNISGAISALSYSPPAHAPIPLPAALPLAASGLAAFGLISVIRRRRQNAA